MTKEKYVREVVKKLKCSGAKKKEIGKQLQSDIQIAIENGESMESIIERMVSAEDVAVDFNENLTEKEIKACKRAKALKIAALVVGILAIIVGGIYWYMPKVYSVGVGDDYAEQEVQERVELIIALFNDNAYEEFYDLSNDMMQDVLKDITLDSIKTQICDEWGEFQSLGNCYMAEGKQMNMNFIIVEVHASYEKCNVVYTITLDEDLKLAGFYVR